MVVLPHITLASFLLGFIWSLFSFTYETTTRAIALFTDPKGVGLTFGKED